MVVGEVGDLSSLGTGEVIGEVPDQGRMVPGSRRRVDLMVVLSLGDRGTGES